MNQTASSRKLLVIAQSARMLVQLTVDAGLRPVVIDCFADEDTRQSAVETIKVASLSLADVQPFVEAMRQRYGLTQVVYGSGFERHTETLDYLEKNWLVLGNSAGVFRRFQDKPAFFAQLAALAIRYPESLFSSPKGRNVAWVGHGEEGCGDWLLKPIRGEGGTDISVYASDRVGKSGEYYWQRHLPGQPMSALFLAMHGKFRILGFNRQWTAAIDADHPFVFAGVINRAELSAANRQLLSEWLEKLVGVYPLQGLGSLDFMLVDGQCYLLEINPRIPASAQLYGESIFSLHVQACGGVLGGGVLSKPKAYQILYARNTIMIPEGLKWPEWVADRPVAGSLIGKGEPICSIIAVGKDAAQVEQRLRHRQNFIEKLFKTGL